MNEENSSTIKTPWKIDVAVLCIFFIRDDCFSKVFEAIREAKPSVLLLWQDGPRPHKPEDIIGIEKCRNIAKNIDWDCNVYRLYNKINYGCDPSTFLSHKWAFSIVDKCIILEDDLVPCQSFFQYCKELLDKYEHDTRINRICGFCNLKNFMSPYDYIFSSVGSGPGFATWKRVADLWDESYKFLDDKYNMNLYFQLKNTHMDKKYYQTCLKHKNEGIAHWETIQTYSRHMNSQLNIIPTKNLISNIGCGDNSTHNAISIKMVPKKLYEIFYPEVHEIVFPLKHPKYVFENIEYKEKLFKIIGKGHPIINLKNRLASIMLRLRYGGGKKLLQGLIKHLKKLIS